LATSAKGGRPHAGPGGKNAREVMSIAEPATFRDGFDRIIGVNEQVNGVMNAKFTKVVRGSHPVCFAKTPGEMIRGSIGQPGEFGDPAMPTTIHRQLPGAFQEIRGVERGGHQCSGSGRERVDGIRERSGDEREREETGLDGSVPRALQFPGESVLNASHLFFRSHRRAFGKKTGPKRIGQTFNGEMHKEMFAGRRV